MPENKEHSRHSILIIEDDPRFAEAVKALLSSEYSVVAAPDTGKAIQLIFHAKPDLVLLDFNLPSMSGLDFLRTARPRCPGTPFIMLTGESAPETIIETMRAGAADYVIKGSEDFDATLRFRIKQTLELFSLKQKHEKLAAKFAKQFEILGTTSCVIKLKQDIAKLRGTEATVLVTGENGTGKELVARNLNLQEGDSSRPFVAVNCAAITANLFESEFFGHVKGAFTGASDNKHGHFKVADGGDIFLDEIGEIPLDLQAKLLRVLQEKTFTPVGSIKPLRVDVRVIAATNRNLLDEVRAGRFREDLYYRINHFELKVPALRERSEDIVPLAEAFLHRDLPMARFSEPAKKEIVQYPWPGNIRQLANAVERAKINVRGSRRPVIKPEHLMLNQNVSARQMSAAAPSDLFPIVKEDINPSRLQKALEWVEKEFLERSLQILGGDNRSAYTLLGMSRAHFFRRKRAVGLSAEPEAVEGVAP